MCVCVCACVLAFSTCDKIRVQLCCKWYFVLINIVRCVALSFALYCITLQFTLQPCSVFIYIVLHWPMCIHVTVCETATFHSCSVLYIKVSQRNIIGYAVHYCSVILHCYIIFHIGYTVFHWAIYVAFETVIYQDYNVSYIKYHTTTM